MLTQVKKGLQQVNKQLKIHSKHFSRVAVKVETNFKDLQKEHKDDNLFIDLDVIKDQKVPTKNVVDVILMDKVITASLSN